MLAAVDHLPRHDAVCQDPSLVVDVFQKEVERGDPLGQSHLHGRPFGGRDDARNQVVREDLFGSFLAAVDREGDALIQEAKVGGLLSALQLVRGQGDKVLQQFSAMSVQIAGTGEHLVVGMIQQVVLQCGALEIGGLGWLHGGTLSI